MYSLQMTVSYEEIHVTAKFALYTNSKYKVIINNADDANNVSLSQFIMLLKREHFSTNITRQLQENISNEAMCNRSCFGSKNEALRNDLD